MSGAPRGPWQRLQRHFRKGAPLPRFLTLALLVGLLAAIANLVVHAQRLAREFDDTTEARTDNLTWFVAQIEVDLLNLRLALAELPADADPALPLPEAAESRIRHAFDILYSRAQAMEAAGPLLSSLHDPAMLAQVERIQRSTAQMAARLDSGPLRTGAMAGMAAQLAALAPDVRGFAVAALAQLTERSAEQRLRQRDVLGRFSALSIMLVVLMSVILFVVADLYRGLLEHARSTRQMSATQRKMIEASRDAVIVTDRDGRIVAFNTAAEALYGISRATAIGQQAPALLNPDPTDPRAVDTMMAQFSRRAANNTLSEPFAMQARLHNGRIAPLEVVVIPDLDSEGQPIFMCFVRDISDRLAVETTLRRARDAAERAAEARARFLTVMSHEMRTPLHGVIAAMDLLGRGRLSRDQRRFLSIAQDCGQSALQQVDDLLALARHEEGAEPEVAFDPAALAQTIADQAATLAAAQGTRVILTVTDPARGTVSGLRRSFERALGNLVSNAVKVTHDGTVRITLDRLHGGVPDGIVTLSVTVADTGPGIAAEDQTRIFDDFETLDWSLTRPSGGTGLGLGIARRAVRAMGGEITLNSAPGAGSSFHFTARLARRDTAAPPAPEPLPAPAPPAEDDIPCAPDPATFCADTLRVLLVEDNNINRTLMQAMLLRMGHAVTLAENGAAALDLAAARCFDVIVTDVGMPVMDGAAAVQALRAGGGCSADTPVLGVTAHALPGDLMRFRAAGMDCVLTKPLRLDQLAEALAAVTAPPNDPLFDHDTLEDSRAMMGAAGHARLVARLAQDLAGTLSALPADPAARAEALHRLGGGAAVLGLRRLRRELSEAEEAARTGKPAAEGLAAALEGTMARSRRALGPAGQAAQSSAQMAQE
ncbi:hybrid sensor histidine kinase/response regulator [Ruixingdingia sedimenti]|uniref:histidine kinase n=1 Tax=Ruixingdingia sedimenti TaxID=3073604 RepID=A0ABU1F3X1_9RHOB|nr:ATP-binding protein [Xinfangfangia sp. LG-4]MDR5651144.1 ATP-binding protein [Xinfangfangia sp. LG-4]